MNILENKMTDILIDLRENYNVVSVKTEFETEGTRFEEALMLKELTLKAGLDLTIKIGGCEAIRDLYEAKTIGVSNIVAPMIETPYAMKKFVKAKNSVFTEEETDNLNFFINIETITGCNNLENIISEQDFSQIKGIVLGRMDMANSMNMTRDDVNSQQIFNMAYVISEKMNALKKDFVIGGGVCMKSVPFFAKIPYLTKFETRKIIFDAPKSLKNPNINQGIIKAIDFEIMWLKNRRENYKILYTQDEKRLKMLEQISHVF